MQVDGLHLHVLDYGGGGSPILMVPGISSPAVMMDFIARALPTTLRPLIVDMRGRGLSDSGDAYDLDTYVRDVAAVVDQLNLERPIMMGHSMGGRVAALAAAQGEIPIRGSIIVDPPMSGPNRGRYPVPVASLLVQHSESLLATNLETIADQCRDWPAREAGMRARWLSSCDARALAETHLGFETEDFFTFWREVPAPTVLMYGADSPMVTDAGAAEAAEVNPDARMVRVPDAGHMVFWDNPAAALPALARAAADLA